MIEDSVVLITGASSGIGKACANAFAAKRARLLVCARRLDRVLDLRRELEVEFPGIHIHAFELDVRDLKSVQRVLATLPDDWKKIDILINNAGLSRGLDKLHEGSYEDWEEMIDTNVKGLLYVTREVVPGMVSRNKGHIINIGSIAGHEVYPRGNVYCASKFAVDAITKGLRIDLVDTQLRVTTIDPGLVETEFSIVRFRGNEEKARQTYKGLVPLFPDDVAEAVLWAATRPPHVQVAEMILFPTAQASSMHVHRE
jgi:3-hydroxy acid dehydrogenase / malonic semialdehyde reductase